MNERSESETDVPTLRSRIRQATAGAILAAAEEVFADQGLHAARMNDIAARAGVAVGTLYNHFKDRDTLLAGLLEARRAEVLEVLDGAITRNASGSFRQRLTRMLQGIFDYFGAHRRFFSIHLQAEMGRYDNTFPVAGCVAPELAKQVLQRIEKLVRIGVKQKALRPDGADLYPAIITGIVRGLLMRDRLLGVAPPVDVEGLVQLFLDGAGT